MREYLDPYNTKLNSYSSELTLLDLTKPTIKSLFKDMVRIASGERDEAHPDRATLVGMSAPQIGEFVRVIIIDLAADPIIPNFTPNLQVFVNPKIVEASTEENLGREGCYSTGKIGGVVYRANKVTVSALDQNGKEFIHKSDNEFQSRIFQHEIDHLDGVRFPSRIRDPKHFHWVDLEDFQNYRKNWQTWSKYYPVEDWLNMYRGEK